MQGVKGSCSAGESDGKVWPGVFVICAVLLVAVIWFGWHITREEANKIPTKTTVADDAGKFLAAADTNLVPEWAQSIIETNNKEQKEVETSTGRVVSASGDDAKSVTEKDLNRFGLSLKNVVRVSVKNQKQ